MSKIDAKALLAALDEHDPGKMHFVDRKTGKIITVTIADKSALESTKKLLASEPSRYTQVPRSQPADNMAEVERFVAGVSDVRFRDVLKRALTSHRPFREFRDALQLKGKEKELREWEAYHGKNLEERAVRFLKSTGLV